MQSQRDIRDEADARKASKQVMPYQPYQPYQPYRPEVRDSDPRYESPRYGTGDSQASKSGYPSTGDPQVAPKGETAFGADFGSAHSSDPASVSISTASRPFQPTVAAPGLVEEPESISTGSMPGGFDDESDVVTVIGRSNDRSNVKGPKDDEDQQISETAADEKNFSAPSRKMSKKEKRKEKKEKMEKRKSVESSPMSPRREDAPAGSKEVKDRVESSPEIDRKMVPATPDSSPSKKRTDGGGVALEMEPSTSYADGFPPIAKVGSAKNDEAERVTDLSLSSRGAQSATQADEQYGSPSGMPNFDFDDSLFVKRSKRREQRRTGNFTPPMASPLRSELQWDGYLGSAASRDLRAKQRTDASPTGSESRRRSRSRDDDAKSRVTWDGSPYELKTAEKRDSESRNVPASRQEPWGGAQPRHLRSVSDEKHRYTSEVRDRERDDGHEPKSPYPEGEYESGHRRHHRRRESEQSEDRDHRSVASESRDDRKGEHRHSKHRRHDSDPIGSPEGVRSSATSVPGDLFEREHKSSRHRSKRDDDVFDDAASFVSSSSRHGEADSKRDSKSKRRCKRDNDDYDDVESVVSSSRYEDEAARDARSSKRGSRHESDNFDDNASVVSSTRYDDDDGKREHRSSKRRSKRESDPFDDAASVASSKYDDDDSRREHRSSKRRSKRDSDPFDDAASVASSKHDDDHHHRHKKEKEKRSSGIFGSLFGTRKSSDSVTESKAKSRDSRRDDEPDDPDRKHRKKKHRDSTHGSDDDDTRSIRSSERREKRRSGTERDDASRDVPESPLKVESPACFSPDATRTGAPSARLTQPILKERSPRESSRPGASSEARYEPANESFLGERAVNTASLPVTETESRDVVASSSPLRGDSDAGLHHLPPLPDSRASSPQPTPDAVEEPAHAPASLQTPVEDSRALVLRLTGLPSSQLQAFADALPPLPLSRPSSPGPVETPMEEPTHSPLSALRASSTTSVPLRFRRPPSSPSVARDSIFSPALPSTPLHAPSHDSPHSRRHSKTSSTEFKGSSEYRPLYLLERNRHSLDAEAALPSLPPSRTPSQAPSEDRETSDEYQSALESPHLSSNNDFEDSFATALQSHRGDQAADVLDSQQTTPKAQAVTGDALGSLGDVPPVRSLDAVSSHGESISDPRSDAARQGLAIDFSDELAAGSEHLQEGLGFRRPHSQRARQLYSTPEGQMRPLPLMIMLVQLRTLTPHVPFPLLLQRLWSSGACLLLPSPLPPLLRPRPNRQCQPKREKRIGKGQRLRVFRMVESRLRCRVSSRHRNVNRSRSRTPETLSRGGFPQNLYPTPQLLAVMLEELSPPTASQKL